jgi:GNAT superfamily N-acetyltransferase
MKLTIHSPVLLTAAHDITDFDSGVASLDEWLKRRALKNNVAGASRCFVTCDGQRVIGYYSLSAGALRHELAPKAMQRNMPDPLPALLLGRLAIDKAYHNQGLGKALLRDAMQRSLNISEQTGVFAVMVHALSEAAKRFYLSCGFVESPLQPMTLAMSLASIRMSLSES